MRLSTEEARSLAKHLVSLVPAGEAMRAERRLSWRSWPGLGRLVWRTW